MSYVSLKKQFAPADKHISNKNERKELTRMMRAAGVDEAAIRSVKSNRQKLAIAADVRPEGLSRNNKIRRRFVNQISTTLGVGVNHPVVQQSATSALMDNIRQRASFLKIDQPNQIELAKEMMDSWIKKNGKKNVK